MEETIKFKKNLIFKRILFIIILLTAFWAIFNFSEQNGYDSGSLSLKFTSKIVNIISRFKTLSVAQKLHYIQRLHPIIRKLAHFSIYMVVGFSMMGFMCTFDIRNIIKVIISFFIGVLYAIGDEIHQYFVPGRSASVTDVGIDSLGVFTGIFILVVIIVFIESIVEWLKK